MIVLDTILAAWLVTYLYTDLPEGDQPHAESGHTAEESRPSIPGGQTSQEKPSTIVKQQSVPSQHAVIEGPRQGIELQAVKRQLDTQVANRDGSESEAETLTVAERERFRAIREGKRPMKMVEASTDI